MYAQLIASQIDAASALKSGSLRFWGEWFGKPHDNWHKIVRCSAEGDKLLIEFNDGGKLTVNDPDGLDLTATRFAIRDAASVRWEWFYYGRPQTAENARGAWWAVLGGPSTFPLGGTLT